MTQTKSDDKFKCKSQKPSDLYQIFMRVMYYIIEHPQVMMILRGNRYQIHQKFDQENELINQALVQNLAHFTVKHRTHQSLKCKMCV